MALLPPATHHPLRERTINQVHMIGKNKEQRDQQKEREITPGPNSFNPVRDPPTRAYPACALSAHAPWLVLPGTSPHQRQLGSPSLLDPIFQWRKAQRFAHADVCPLSIQWPSPPPSRALSPGLSAGCSGGREAPVSVVFSFHTSSICCPLCVQTTLDTLQTAYACSSVCRALLYMISRFSLGHMSCSRHYPSVYVRVFWSSSGPPTLPLPLCSLRRCV